MKGSKTAAFRACLHTQIYLEGTDLHTQSGITKEVVWALRMFSMTGFVIRWPRIVMFFHSFGVRVISLKRWFVL